ncbi:DUF362 domain-containing protein [Candidatus Poribacteria bacterium]|nr:DUF362 domain-containing protein [Candidatus Poribacteria bacterium]
MKKSRVAIEKLAGSPPLAVNKLLARFPEIVRRLHDCKKVFIKINAVYFHPHLHTSLPLIESVVEYVRSIDSKKEIFLVENCSQGNFTRLCFTTIGLDGLARRLRLRCLFLDEEKSVRVTIGEGEREEKIRFPKILYDNLIVERKNSIYVNMPVLKAHCQTQMTAGIKNQMGLLYDIDKAKNHNRHLHQKLVNILKFIRPDFTLVDALKVLARGPMPPGRFAKDLLHEKDVIVGGEDVVAVDAVCARILGHEPVEIKHVALAAEQGLGVADLNSIEIEGEMPPCSEKIPWELNTHFPDSLRVVVGKGGACYEGCLGHLEQVIELLVNEKYSPNDFSSLPLTIVTGKGFEAGQIENLVEPVILLGECACKELHETLKNKYLQVDALNTCGRCDNIVACVARNMNVDVFDLSPLSRLEVYRQFLTGRLKGLRYTIPR